MRFSSDITLLIQRTLPLATGVFAIMAVQLVDTVFIGMLGVNALSAQGLTLPFSILIISLQVGVGVAGTALIAKLNGESQQSRASAVALMMLLLGCSLIAIISMIGWWLEASIFNFFIDDGITASHRVVVFNLFSDYWQVWLISMFFGAGFYFVSSVYRANQDTRTPGKVLVWSSLINLMLDPIFIFALDMGIQGAAIASAIAFLLCMLYMFKRAIPNQWLEPPWNNLESVGVDSVQLVRNAIATTTNQFLPAVSALFTMYFIAGLGTQAVAIWGLTMRIESFLLVFSLAMTMSMPPIVATYLGQNRTEEIAKIIKAAVKLVLAVHTSMALVVVIGSPFLAAWLSPDAKLTTAFQSALLVLPLSYGPLGLCMVMVSAFNALDLPKRALKISMIRLTVLYIPAIYVGSRFGDIEAVILAASMANLCAGIFAWLSMTHYLRESEGALRLSEDIES